MVFDWDKRYLTAAGVVILLLTFAGGMKYAQQRTQEKMAAQITVEQKRADNNSDPVAEENIQVYVVGAVSKPGVYHLPVAARVYEAIDMAQALPSADLRNINLAEKLSDGQAVVVPAQGEELNETLSHGAGLSLNTSSGSGMVNINQASSQELDEKLPGIGPAIAERIVDYRDSHGRFVKAEDLQEVSGIGEKKYAEIQDLISVR